jgi:hypothetical protein
MRAIIQTEPGVLELNYMWLPTFIGMNAALKQAMEKDLAEKMQGIPLDNRGLDRAHDVVVDYLVAKFPEIHGLPKFLDAMKFIEL